MTGVFGPIFIRRNLTDVIESQVRLYPIILAAALIAFGFTRVPQATVESRPLWSIGAIQPRISPDGSKIIFAYQGAIWRIPSDGGLMRRLTSNAAWDSNPAWSPDGKLIGFLSGDIVTLIDAQTGASIPLSKQIKGRGLVHFSSGGSIQFSSDGKKLLGNFLIENHYQLAWLNVEDGSLKSVLNPPALGESICTFGRWPDARLRYEPGRRR